MIIFKSEKARSFLIEHGFVYTLRARKRRTGRSLVKDSLKGSPLFYADVYFVGEVPLDEASLEPYVAYSGFDSAEEWLSEFKKLNGSSSTAFLYKVIRVRA